MATQNTQESAKAYLWIAECAEPGVDTLTGGGVRYALTETPTPPADVERTTHEPTGIVWADSVYHGWELHSIHTGSVVPIYGGHDTGLLKPGGHVFTAEELGVSTRLRRKSK